MSPQSCVIAVMRWCHTALQMGELQSEVLNHLCVCRLSVLHVGCGKLSAGRNRMELMCRAMSPEDKADPARLGAAARQRVAQASSCTVAQVPRCRDNPGCVYEFQFRFRISRCCVVAVATSTVGS